MACSGNQWPAIDEALLHPATTSVSRIAGRIRRSMPPPWRREPALGCVPGSDMLVDQDGVPVRVHGDEARGAGRLLVRLGRERHALGLQLALQLAHVGERA